jgi:hypothetical protein
MKKMKYMIKLLKFFLWFIFFIFFFQIIKKIDKSFNIQEMVLTLGQHRPKGVVFTAQGFFPGFWEHDPYTHGIGNFSGV